jgi:hypothetical protein
MAVSKTERERLQIWRNRVGWSRTKREPAIKRYEQFKRFYIGDQWDPTATSLENPLIVNLIYSHIKATLPGLYFQDPYFFLEPREKTYEPNIPVGESVLNYYVKHNKMKRYVRLATLDAILFMGILKVGYDPQFMSNPRGGGKVSAGQDEKGNDVWITDPQTGQPLVEPEELLTEDNFFIERVSPANMLFDAEPTNFIEDGTWIGEEIIERLDKVQDNPDYSFRSKLKETHIASKETFVGPEDNPDVQDDLKRIRLVHIYDFIDGVYRVYADGQESNVGFLYEEDIDKGIDLHPYSVLKFHEIPDETYPLSEVQVLSPIQVEYNKMITMLVTHAKRFVRKYTAEMGTFGDPAEKEKLLEPEDGMIVEIVKGMTGKIMPIQDAMMDPAILQCLQEIPMAFWKTAGASESERATVERRKTMFEASQISKYTQLRNEDRVSLVEDWISNIGKKLYDQLQANLRVPTAIKISNKYGQFWKEGITKDDIQGDFDVNVRIGSTKPKIPEFEKQDMAEFMQALSTIPNIQAYLNPPGQMGIDLTEMVKKIAKLFDFEDDIMKPRPMPPMMPGMPGMPGQGPMGQMGGGQPAPNRPRTAGRRSRPPRRPMPGGQGGIPNMGVMPGPK